MEDRIQQYHREIFAHQEREVRMAHPEYSEEDIQARCRELQNIVLTNESMNNRFRNEKVNKIWSATQTKRF